jgi:DNA-binding transcriptional regulator YhcF (GntR family)
MVASDRGSLPLTGAMGKQLTYETTERPVPEPVPGAAGASAAAIGPLLERTTRLAAALVRSPVARAYLGGTRSLVLRGWFSGNGAAAIDDADALEAAGRAVRTGLPSVSSPVGPRPPSTAEAARAGATRRSHAGVPLRGSAGLVIGAVVVSDVDVRSWTPEELEHLTELAALGMAGFRLVVSGGAAAAGGGGEGGRSTWPPAAGPRSAPPNLTEDRATPPSRVPDDRLITPSGARDEGLGTDGALVEVLRQRIVGSLDLGALRPGDRLPSIRQTARAFSVTPYMVLQAYAELAVEGLVDRRERSGIFVAEFEIAATPGLPETGAWLTEVLTQACQHQVKIPNLPDLIRRWTSAVPVRCACVESCHDSRYALALELSQQFGIEAVAMPGRVTSRDLGETDLVITTAYHAAELGPLAAQAHRPLLIATVSPLILSSALHHLRDHDLTVICVDAVYGERLRALHGGAYRDRVRVVTVDDGGAIAELDRTQAVLLTPAARHRLQQPDFRLVAPLFPSYSLDFARKVAEALVRINLGRARA